MPTSCFYRHRVRFSGRHKEQLPRQRELLLLVLVVVYVYRQKQRGRRKRGNLKQRTSSASSSSSSVSVDDKHELHVLTFDLDDTVWPTLPVVTAANESYIKWLQTRVENFPETRVMNELMKGIRGGKGGDVSDAREKNTWYVLLFLFVLLYFVNRFLLSLMMVVLISRKRRRYRTLRSE